MFTQLVLPSKRRVDVITVEADFFQLVAPSDFIVDAAVTVSVFSGEDSNPSHMLDGGVLISGTIVGQRIKLGVPGVVYQLLFTITTDQGFVYTIEGRQAVLRNALPPGTLYTEHYFTTPVYPIEDIEAMASSAMAIGGFTWVPPVEGIDSISSLVSGQLRQVLKSYTDWPPEGVDSLSTLVSGELKRVLIIYSDWPPEGINSTASAQSGTLRNLYIQYTTWPAEGIDSTASVISGTLL